MGYGEIRRGLWFDLADSEDNTKQAEMMKKPFWVTLQQFVFGD